MGWMSEQELKKRSRKRTSNNRTTTGFRISDELWAVLQPLLPVPLNTHRFGVGRPRVSDRACADAIFYVLRTGCQWQALDQTELCAHSTAHDRFQEWVKAGVFLKLWQAGVERLADWLETLFQQFVVRFIHVLDAQIQELRPCLRCWLPPIPCARKCQRRLHS